MRIFSTFVILMFSMLCGVSHAQTSTSDVIPFNPTEDCASPASQENALCKAFANEICSPSLGVTACIEKIEQKWSETKRQELEDQEKKLKEEQGLLPGFGGGITSELILLISSAITAGVIAWLQKLRGNIGALKDSLLKYKRRLSDPVLSTPSLSSDVEGVNVVLIGDGGVGKTSIVRALSGSPFADPHSASDGEETYALAQEVDLIGRNSEPIRRMTRIYLEDHKGQDISGMMLSETVTKRQKMVPSTVIVIVVDLFASQKNMKKQASFQKKRITEQLSKYNSDALKTIRHKFYYNSKTEDKTVKAVCLFINKIDLLKTIDTASLAAAEKAYEPLIDDMNQKFADAGTYVILGAAAVGWGVVGHNKENRGTDKTLQEIIMKSTSKIKIDQT